MRCRNCHAKPKAGEGRVGTILKWPPWRYRKLLRRCSRGAQASNWRWKSHFQTQSFMLISIDGCVGIGKTTVARGLASFRGSSVLLESFELNPFLREFYENPAGTAIETEFSFLLLHFHQLKSVAATVATSEVVADFHLGKDLLYADLNLRNVHARRVFQDLYAFCRPAVPKPDILVFLSGPTPLIVERIRSRQRDFELKIAPEYYGVINAAYERSYLAYSGNKLRLDMNEWDFISDKNLYAALDELINRELK